MLYALDINNGKIKPNKGERAICPYCFESVIAVCGEINIHHWRHDVLANCDPWKEHESEWHRAWKEKFPEDWRETIITKNGEKHVADIKTHFELVLELQNSFISIGTIRIREDFYDNMVWLINANKFRDNLSIYSMVTTRLRNLKIKYEYNLDYLNDFESMFKVYYDELEKIEEKIETIQNQKKNAQNKIEQFEIFYKEINERFVKFVDSNFYLSIIWEFESELIKIIKKLNDNIEELNKSIKIEQRKIDLINNFPTARVEGYEKYKEVDFNKIQPIFFSICKLIVKDSLNKIFTEVP